MNPPASTARAEIRREVNPPGGGRNGAVAPAELSRIPRSTELSRLSRLRRAHPTRTRRTRRSRWRRVWGPGGPGPHPARFRGDPAAGGRRVDLAATGAETVGVDVTPGRCRSTTAAGSPTACGRRGCHRPRRVHPRRDVPGRHRHPRHPGPGRSAGGLPCAAAGDVHRPRGRLRRTDRTRRSPQWSRRPRRHHLDARHRPRMDPQERQRRTDQTRRGLRPWCSHRRDRDGTRRRGSPRRAGRGRARRGPHRHPAVDDLRLPHLPPRYRGRPAGADPTRSVPADSGTAWGTFRPRSGGQGHPGPPRSPSVG